MQSKQNDAHIKRMADLLRTGATLTDLACPNCASPLFRLKDGSLWCGVDEKKVVIVKEGEEPPKPATMIDPAMEKLESTLLAKVANLQDKIERSNDAEELTKLSLALSELLNSIEKIRKMKKI